MTKVPRLSVVLLLTVHGLCEDSQLLKATRIFSAQSLVKQSGMVFKAAPNKNCFKEVMSRLIPSMTLTLFLTCIILHSSDEPIDSCVVVIPQVVKE